MELSNLSKLKDYQEYIQSKVGFELLMDYSLQFNFEADKKMKTSFYINQENIRIDVNICGDHISIENSITELCIGLRKKLMRIKNH